MVPSSQCGGHCRASGVDLSDKNLALPVLDFRDPVFSTGAGSWVTDEEGNAFLDVSSGQFCAIFGHSYPKLGELFERIATSLQDTDTSSLSASVLSAFADLRRITPDDDFRFLLLSTGAEANEACFKYAKFLARKPGILTFDRGYHGLTHGTAAYSLSRDRIRPPLPGSHCIHLPEGKYELGPADEAQMLVELDSVLERNGHEIAMVFFEPLISGGGFYIPSAEFFSAAQEIVRSRGIFFGLDECQTGMGRTGHWFLYQNYGLSPDFVTTAKGLGAGFPVACLMVSTSAFAGDALEMKYFSSHQNEPFAGSLVSFVISEIEQRFLLERNQRMGELLMRKTSELMGEKGSISNVRGRGMMIGFDVVGPHGEPLAEQLCSLAIGHGLLLQHCNYGRTVRLLPNYLITEQEVDELIVRLAKCVADLECLL